MHVALYGGIGKILVRQIGWQGRGIEKYIVQQTQINLFLPQTPQRGGGFGLRVRLGQMGNDDPHVGMGPGNRPHGTGLIGPTAHCAQIQHQEQIAPLDLVPQPGNLGCVQAAVRMQAAQASRHRTLQLDRPEPGTRHDGLEKGVAVGSPRVEESGQNQTLRVALQGLACIVVALSVRSAL